METLRPTLLIVCDVRVYSDHLKAALALRLCGMTIAAASADEAIQQVIHNGPGLVLLDLRCRDSQRVVQTLGAARPNCRFIAFAVDDDEREILACAEAGASGYVPIDASVDDLAHVVELVMRGDQHLPPRVAAALLRQLGRPDAADPQAVSNLTVRERQILGLVVEGLTNKEIASRLNIEVATVKNHVHSVLLKLHVKSRSEAAARVRDGSRSRMQIPAVHPS